MTWAPGMLRAQARFDEAADLAPIDQMLAAGLGVKSLRWNFLQTKTANANFSIYAPALAKMKEKGLKHFLTLFGAPYIGDPGVYADWAEAAMLWHVATFPGVLEAVEVWNEPNGTNWPINSTDYMVLLREIELRKRRRSALGAVKLVGPCAGGGFMDRCIAAGMLPLVQAVSFHMYLTPEQMYQGCVDHNKKLSAAGRADLRLCISEWGAIPGTLASGLSERALACFKATGSGASYFPLKDYGAFADKGLLTAAGALKTPGADWKRFFLNIPETLVFNKRDVLTATAWSFLFKSGTTYRRIMWSTKSGGETIKVAGQPKQLTAQPVYVSGNVTVTL